MKFKLITLENDTTCNIEANNPMEFVSEMVNYFGTEILEDQENIWDAYKSAVDTGKGERREFSDPESNFNLYLVPSKVFYCKWTTEIVYNGIRCLICENLGSAFFMDNKILCSCPLLTDNSFDIEESCDVEFWEDIEEEDASFVKSFFNIV